MKCLHPTNAYYTDLIGVRRYYTRPCGHCIACLHNTQDSWQIRALEETKAHPQFVYDTLTFSPASLPLTPVSDIVSANPFIEISAQSQKALKYYDKDCRFIPYVDRQIFRDWIRRGRELYAKHNGGKRPQWHYMLFMEYGPRTSRPHAHCMFWNISKADYKRYLGRPWTQRYGYTKPSYFNGTSTQKDRECITRYISKYCSKGVFESPWVTDGLLPKPCKLVSNGLGIAYLDKAVFDWFRNPLASALREMACGVRNPDPQWGYDDPNDFKRHVVDLIKSDIAEGVVVPDSALDALSTYRDAEGYPHALPRYYKQKILNLLRPNVLSYKVQTDLLARAELHHNKALQAFARGLVGFAARLSKKAFAAPLLGLGRKLYNLLDIEFTLAQKLQAEAAARRRKTRLRNHYLRPLLGKSQNDFRFGVTSSFLAMVA